MGVTKDLVTAGDDKTFPKIGDELTMHYTGWLARTETKFDSSVDKDKPFVFKARCALPGYTLPHYTRHAERL